MDKQKRDKQIGVSLSEDELKAVKKLAFEDDKSLSAYIRSLILKEIKKMNKERS